MRNFKKLFLFLKVQEEENSNYEDTIFYDTPEARLFINLFME